MSRKEILTKTINFGRKGDIGRQLVERIEKKYGNRALSNIVRKSLIACMSNKPEFKEAKKRALLEERKEIRKKLKEANDQMQKNADELEKLGYEFEKF